MILLDTHIVYWWLTDDRPLSRSLRSTIESTNDVLVSAVTGWEIAIKVKLGKWPGAAPLLPDLERTLNDEGFRLLDLTMSQAKLAGGLDLEHKDPFDRLLAAQALDLNIPIATVDPVFKQFNCVVCE